MTRNPRLVLLFPEKYQIGKLHYTECSLKGDISNHRLLYYRFTCRDFVSVTVSDTDRFEKLYTHTPCSHGTGFTLHDIFVCRHEATMGANAYSFDRFGISIQVSDAKNLHCLLLLTKFDMFR